MKVSQPIANKLIALIGGRQGGAVTIHELLGAGPRPAVDQALSRLVRQGRILRVGRGLYARPKISKILKEPMTPSPYQLAQAWARKNGLRIIPHGAYAANLLGLSTQVPAKIIYYTNGRTKTLKMGPFTVKFLNRGPKTMDIRGRISPLVFQALRYLGKDGITQQAISRLISMIPRKDKAELKRNLRYATSWMKPILEQIIEGEPR